jgi:hypothetical protein
MSARKKVNQSRPRALARAAASRVAGAVCFDAADDAKPPPTRRSSRPPSNSSANADSSMSPAPSGIYGVGFWPSAPCNRPPLIILRRAAPGHAQRRAAVVLRVGVRLGKGGNFEKSPVSSMELGTMRGGLQRKSGIFRSSSRSMGDMELLLAGSDCPKRLPRLRSADVKIARWRRLTCARESRRSP